jgi:cephalosporin hydroxylase
MNQTEKFAAECRDEVGRQALDAEFSSLSQRWFDAANRHKYSYHFNWLGRPIIQYPQDVMAMQEVIWSVQPDLIIETGIAHGGSLIFSAAMLELNAICGGPADAEVVGIDIDIRAHNRAAIEAHPLFRRITLIEGSSIEKSVIERVRALAKKKARALVCLDSNHTHAHVLAELEAYAPLVAVGSYCVVFDTVIERLPADMFPDRPWGPGDNPMTAVDTYLEHHPEFMVDTAMDAKVMISVAPRGYLKRVV